MMTDTSKTYLYGIGRLLRRGSRDIIFLFGDKVCSEAEGGRTVGINRDALVALVKGC